jgi:hypothetical protein
MVVLNLNFDGGCMPKTVVGLFENDRFVDAAVREIEALGFPLQEVRTIKEPASFPVTSVMSFPRLDFEVELGRELTRIGATIQESRAYVEGLRRGGALAFATGSDEKVAAAGNIMNLHGAMKVEQLVGSEPSLPSSNHTAATALDDNAVMAGRVRQPGGGAVLFVW